jgi:nucleoporin NDC1
LERNKNPTYKQVVDICLLEIKEINRRINTALDPKYRPEGATGEEAPAVPFSLVPQISQSLLNGAIAGPGDAPETRLQKVGAVTSQIARAHSSPQNAQNATARVYLKQGQEKLQQSTQQAESLLTTYSNKFASSPFGSPFRSCIRRTANVVVNGAPYSRQSSILNAITTLANLTVFSLTEDEFGQFNTEVPEMVRVFTAAIKKIEEYMAGLQIHWTDVDCWARPEAERKKIPEVEVVMEALKEGLERILGAFNEFLIPMGMTRAEVQEAKKVVVKLVMKEIEEVRR